VSERGIRERQREGDKRETERQRESAREGDKRESERNRKREG